MFLNKATGSHPRKADSVSFLTTCRRSAEASGSSALFNEYEQVQASTTNQRQSGFQDDCRPQYPAVGSNVEKGSSNGGGHPVAATFPVRRLDSETFQEKSLATEKVNLELFEWPKIMTSLTRKEKEDDFTAIKGTKLPQRPKRRLKIVEKNVQVSICFVKSGNILLQNKILGF
jgi:hypothetical protein